MAPLSADAISHFTHPAHKLNYLTTNTAFLCDGCKLPGAGPRFTCVTCSFDLHDHCAKCPSRLTSTTNHPHPMSLVVNTPNQTQSCHNCYNPVKGLAYHCKACNFWVHTLCVSTLTNSRHNQDRTVPSSSAAAAAGQRVGGQIAVGLATNYIYDELKGEPNKVPSTSGADAGALEDDEGFFDAITSGFMSIFESLGS